MKSMFYKNQKPHHLLYESTAPVGITVNSNGKSIAEECEQQTEQTNVLTAINNDASEKQKIPNKNKLNNHCSHSTGNDPCMSVK